MIELNDPYWRRLLTYSVGGVVALAVVALVAFPTNENDEGPGTARPYAASLNVSAVNTAQASVPADQWLVFVDVTDAGTLSAQNLTAHVQGVTLVDEPATTGTATGSVNRGASATAAITVERPLHIALSLRGNGFTPAGSLSLTLASPSGKSWTGSGSGTSQSLSIDAADLGDAPDGDYTATVTHTGGLRAISYTLNVNVTHPPADEAQAWPALSPGESHKFLWMAKSPTAPEATVSLDATLVDAKGGSAPVHYLAGTNESKEVTALGGGTVFLTSGEFLGFSAIGIIGLAVASGAMRTRGGRATSQDRARREVTLHRLAWTAVLVLVAIHGTVQIASGHLDDTGAILAGVAAFATLGSLIWFNAYNRKRVLAMAWPHWLRLKLVWVAAALSLIAVHLLFFGRHFVG